MLTGIQRTKAKTRVIMTDNQRIYPGVIFAFLIILCGFIAGCTTPSPATSAPAVAALPAPLPTTGTNSTVERISFKEELASGRIIFAHVNYDLPENTILAKKYGVTGSSLWIGVYNGTALHKEEDIRVWSLINNKDAYSTYLSAVITKRLNGDLS